MGRYHLNYGAIGNCKTAALVSDKGSIDWLCLPDMDSPSLFGRILDYDNGGYWSIEVDDTYTITQSYIKNTNIINTIFASQEGIFELIDFIPRYHIGETSYFTPPEIYRYIKYKSGTPRFKVHFYIAPNYARDKYSLVFNPENLQLNISENDSCYLYSDIDLHRIVNSEEIVLEKDQFMLLSYNEKLIKIDLMRVDLEYSRTKVYWLNWSNRTIVCNAYQDVITRSLLVLKLMSYKTGAVLAALTTSIPEAIGAERNWDYRYCWLRDASMAVETMGNAGHFGAANSFIEFIKNTFISRYDAFQIMYGIRGEKILTEQELHHLSGYMNSRPVRIGNDAYHQKQNDTFGYLMSVVYLFFDRFSDNLSQVEWLWEVVKRIANTVIKEWKNPDKGIWEIRGDPQNFISSKVMSWVALDRASRIAKRLNNFELESRWRLEAKHVKDDVLKYGWNEQEQTFTQAYENNYLDSSLLLMESYGFISAKDEQYIKTVHKIKKVLLHEGLMYRYNSPDDFGVPTSSFTICSLWMVRALYTIGEVVEAKTLFNKLLTYSNHIGLFSEDIDYTTKQPLGNFPQAYSHLAIVDIAHLLSREIDVTPFVKP